MQVVFPPTCVEWLYRHESVVRALFVVTCAPREGVADGKAGEAVGDASYLLRPLINKYVIKLWYKQTSKYTCK
jgi:hypothetical protein